MAALISAGRVSVPETPPNPAETSCRGAALLAERRGLRTCLDAVPHFVFSETGRANLCRRFYLNDAELTAALVAYSEGAQP